LVVNLTTRFEGCGPAEKKIFRLRPRRIVDIVLRDKKNRPTPDAFTATAPARR
jgi:hypothetical protein